MSEYHLACPDCLGMMEKHMVYYIDCNSSNMVVVSREGSSVTLGGGNCLSACPCGSRLYLGGRDVNESLSA